MKVFKIAICITGQLSRLETQTKIKNIFKENQAKNVVLHGFASLERGQARYSNAVTSSNCSLSSTALEEISPWLVSSSINDHKSLSGSVNHQTWKNYRREKSSRERRARLENHLAQFWQMRNCAQLIEAHEKKSKIYYDVILKIRDNTLVQRAFNYNEKKIRAIKKPMVKKCLSWKGYNDKVILFPRGFMSDVLKAPVEDFFLKPELSQKIRNTETWLKQVYDSRELLVGKESNLSSFPFVDGRCAFVRGQERWFPVDPKKDCSLLSLL